MQQQGKEKRRRVAVACSRCRTRKLRCDGGRPSCLQCRIGHSDCVWPPAGQSSDMAQLPSPPDHPEEREGSANSSAASPSRKTIDSHRSSLNAALPSAGSIDVQGHIPFWQTATNVQATSASALLGDSLDFGWLMNDASNDIPTGSSNTDKSPSSYVGGDVGTAAGSSRAAQGNPQHHHRHETGSGVGSEAGLEGMTKEDVFMRAFGVLSKAYELPEMVSFDGQDGIRRSTDQIAVQESAHCLSSRFTGLMDVQEQQCASGAVQEHLVFALNNVGHLLQHPTKAGVVAVTLLGWAFYGQGDLQACSRYAEIGHMMFLSLDQQERDSFIVSSIFRQYGMELAQRHALPQAVLQQITELVKKSSYAVGEDDKNEVMMDYGNPSHALVEVLTNIEGLMFELLEDIQHSASLRDLQGRGSGLGAVLADGQTFYAPLGIEMMMKGERAEQLLSMEDRASILYASMPDSFAFNVENFIKHDKQGQGTQFLAIHVKYEAFMCTACQMRAIDTLRFGEQSDARKNDVVWEDLQTATSAARSLADDLVVAEAVAPWCVAANPSLDRPIYITAIAVLFTFKILTGHYFILTKESELPKVNARKRLLINVLRQNFSACYRALRLLSRFWTGSAKYYTQLEKNIAMVGGGGGVSA